MKTSRTNLVRDIEALKNKLAFFEDALNKLDGVKHFPSKGDTYLYCFPSGIIDTCYAQDDRVRPYAYKTRDEAVMAYNKAVALEKIKRRILELQGDWIPNCKDDNEKYCIHYDHYEGWFKTDYWYTVQQNTIIPYMRSEEITSTIINEFHSELKLIFDIT